MHFSIHRSRDVRDTATGWQDVEGDLSDYICKYIWSPTLFKDGIRSSATVLQSTCIVIDVDSGVSILEAAELTAGYQVIIGTTKSHTEDKHRFRVILFTTSSCDPRFYKATSMQWCKLLGGDLVCCESARLYFPCTDVVHVGQGRCVRVVEEDFSVEFHKRKSGDVQKSYMANIKKLKAGAGMTRGNRNNFMHICACDAAALGKPAEIIYKTLRGYTDLPDKELMTLIKSAVARRG